MTDQTLTPKQVRALKLVEWFVPSRVDWRRVPLGRIQPLFKVGVRQSSLGLPSRVAFFQISERGQWPESVTNVRSLARLLAGQRWMAAHIKQWKEGLAEGTLFLSDFNRSAPYVRDLVRREVFGL